MELPVSDRLDVHVRALEGFPDETDRGAAFLDPHYAIVEVVVRLNCCDDGGNDARFYCLRRSLGDLLHLETRLTQGGRHVVGIAASVEAYERGLPRPRFGSLTRQTERLLVQLETALTNVLASRCARAVKLFFGCAAMRSQDANGVVERCIQGEEMQEEAIIGGGSVSHEVPVETASIVVWKFAFDGDAVDLSVVFTPSEEGALGEDTARVADLDPYSAAALAWNPSAERERDDERVVLKYATRYIRQTGDNGDNTVWIHGASRVPSDTGGVVTFEWTDAGEASIFSKALQFQTRMCRADDTNRDAWTALSMSLAEGDEEGEEDSLKWLEAIVATSSLMMWPPETTESPPLDVAHEDTSSGVTFSQASRQNDGRILELEGKVFKLEEELQAVRTELTSTKSELEISSEIYKASLETIAQLETAPRRTQQSNGVVNSNGDVDYSDDADSYGDDDDHNYASDEDEAEEEPADGETTRLRDLVATFQEQCLWRSIETSESEKRNLLLEAELNQLDQDKLALLDKLALRDQECAALHAETQKLKAQKTVLVKEVKRLQPYSQVNLSALIREAEEARMMQRSLQAQLQAITAASTPETDHPVAR